MSETEVWAREVALGNARGYEDLSPELKQFYATIYVGDQLGRVVELLEAFRVSGVPVEMVP